MKFIGRIMLTNWIHIVGFYITMYLSVILFKLFRIECFSFDAWVIQIGFGLISITLLFLIYGLPIIGAFYVTLLLMDIVFFRFTSLKSTTILMLEWSLVVPIFIYWAFLYEYWLWIVLSISFWITQTIRGRWIQKHALAITS